MWYIKHARDAAGIPEMDSGEENRHVSFHRVQKRIRGAAIRAKAYGWPIAALI